MSENNRVNLVIIGAGRGGRALIELLFQDPTVEIVGIADLDPKAPGIVLAKRLKIRCTSDYRRLLKRRKVDLIMDVTGDPAVGADIAKIAPTAEIIGGHSARFMWEMVEARIKSREEIERLLIEYQSLYELGLKLTASENPEKLYHTIVDYATGLTNTPAGSLTIFEEKQGTMSLAAVKGVTKRFSNKNRWKVRQGGLTSHILNQDVPLAVQDVKRHPKFDNPIMVREGIRSLIASPLKTEGRIVGILYVDDFKPRQFTTREVSLLSLLSTFAAMAIEKTKLLESTRQLAITDELTGLYNHRHFRQQLSLEVNRADRYHRSLSLMMIDIDYFKNYNDTNGHLKGNEVLKDLGKILKEISREVDIVARYGGEEFTIIMPETTRRRALILSERLRRRIAFHKFENARSQPNKRLTVSIGLASYPECAANAFDLIAEADKALYEAKRAGRNTVCVSTRKLRMTAQGRVPVLKTG
ncbi:MAG TPA: diguanylate cyclase [Nitrospiria bacterium]|nr:diguanylate cyclase [Nitrospiria bacterium]